MQEPVANDAEVKRRFSLVQAEVEVRRGRARQYLDMASYHLLNVFTAEDGSHGNALGVFIDGAEVPESERQRVAADLGYSETVFVDDMADGRLQIFTPASELPL